MRYLVPVEDGSREVGMGEEEESVRSEREMIDIENITR